MKHYKVGESVPLDYPRGITGAPMPTAWYALRVPPQKERAVREFLKQKGVHACYPERGKVVQIRGKRHERKFPVITQIVYAKFRHQPQWDVLKARRIITGVFSYDDRPIRIPGDIVRAVMGLPTRAEELEAARQELLRVREGERAEIVEGPLSGFLVDVRKVQDGRVWFETLTGIKGEAATSAMKRANVVE